MENLIPNQTYTFSLRSSNNDLVKPGIGFFEAFDVEYNPIEEGYIDTIDGKVTFTWKENYATARVIFDSWGITEEVGEYELTLYPQLEIGDTVTEWAPYGEYIIVTKPYIEDFSTVTVSVSGKAYTPNADGTVEDIQSVSPTMEIATDNEHANIIEFTYLVDTKKYIDSHSGGGAVLGDIETALDNIIAIQENLIGGDGV